MDTLAVLGRELSTWGSWEIGGGYSGYIPSFSPPRAGSQIHLGKGMKVSVFCSFFWMQRGIEAVPASKLSQSSPRTEHRPHFGDHGWVWAGIYCSPKCRWEMACCLENTNLALQCVGPNYKEKPRSPLESFAFDIQDYLILLVSQKCPLWFQCSLRGSDATDYPTLYIKMQVTTLAGRSYPPLS